MISVDNMKNQSVVSYLKGSQEAETILPTCDSLIVQSVQNSFCSLRPLSGYCMDTSNYVDVLYFFLIIIIRSDTTKNKLLVYSIYFILYNIFFLFVYIFSTKNNEIPGTLELELLGLDFPVVQKFLIVTAGLLRLGRCSDDLYKH